MDHPWNSDRRNILELMAGGLAGTLSGAHKLMAAP